MERDALAPPRNIGYLIDFRRRGGARRPPRLLWGTPIYVNRMNSALKRGGSLCFCSAAECVLFFLAELGPNLLFHVLRATKVRFVRCASSSRRLSVVVGVDYRDRPPQLMSAETDRETERETAFFYFRRARRTNGS